MDFNRITKNFLAEIKDKNSRKNFITTLVAVVIACLAVSITVFCVQTYGNSDLKTNCSYLDPITMDFFAFAAGMFLFLEGLISVIKHPGISPKWQLSRIVRISIGAGLLTLHIMQFIHK